MTKTPRTEPFLRHYQDYDQWFERHRAAYLSELLAVRALLPWQGRGLEIGVGTGRFGGPLGVKIGIDPVAEMLPYARARGVTVVQAIAEALPFPDGVFDSVLIVTTMCFVDDRSATLRQAARVLRPGGALVIGLIDRESPLGQDYLVHQTESIFYREATFLSASEVEALLTDSGFGELNWIQTLHTPLSRTKEIESATAGTGRGAFLVVRATRGDKRRGDPTSNGQSSIG